MRHGVGDQEAFFAKDKLLRDEYASQMCGYISCTVLAASLVIESEHLPRGMRRGFEGWRKPGKERQTCHLPI